MIIQSPLVKLINYAFKKEAGQFMTSITIRSLGLGMVLLYEPIYIYQYFSGSLSLTFLYFALIHGIYGVFAVFGGKIMSRLGLKKTMLFSHLFYWAYFVTLFFLYEFWLLILLAIVLRAFGMMLFWPSFHTSFIHATENGSDGSEVGKLNVVFSLPYVVAPIIGGVILNILGYSGLFVVVLLVLFCSAIPLFASKEVYVEYSDSYTKALKRIFKKSNRKMSLSFVSYVLESGINAYVWPLFMLSLSISFTFMGGITTFALILTALFTMYMSKISNKIMNRVEFLNIGSFLTFISWIIKYFVVAPFDVFLSHGLYRICRTSASIPWQAFFYERFSLKGDKSDEYVIYYEITSNLARFFFFTFLAILFMFISSLKIIFLMGAVISLGFMFMGVPPRIRVK